MSGLGLSGFDITAVVVAALVIFVIFAGVKTVPQGYNYTVERFQKYTRTLHPGLTIIVPFIDQIGHKMNVMEQVLDIPRQDVISRDNAIVLVDGVAFFQVVDAAQASYEVANLERAILALTMTNIRSVLGSMDLDHMLSQRDEINSRLMQVVDAAAGSWGVKVTRIEIKDITPPSDIVTAMGRQMKAEREKRASILVAEGAKQAQILEAEGRKEAAFRDAEARERSAQAEATATEMVSEAVARGDMAALNYFVALKYVEALKAMASAPNQKTMIIPYEATALIGALGGVAEIARDAFSGSPAAAKPPGPPGPRARASRRAVLPGRGEAGRRGLTPMLLTMWAALGAWRWFVLGLILLAFELIAPGTMLLWLGVAAIAVGAIALLIDPGWQFEIVAFALLSLAAAVGWWFFGRPDNAAASDRPMLNRRAERHVGKVFTLDAPIVNGDGRLRIDDTTWRVSGPDLPAGARVKVLGVEGITLQVAAEG